MINNPFSHSSYMLRKQFLKLFGGTFRIFDSYGNLALFASMKAFTLKEDIRLYTNEAKTDEVLVIKARNILDFIGTYDVYDPQTQQKIGAFRRRPLISMFRDEWAIMDAFDQEVGVIQEDSLLMALLRRYLTNLIPQKFNGSVSSMPVFTFKQHFDPFVQKLDLDFSQDINNQLDRRMGIAAAILICAIEGRQRD